jgi:hypothetical protein
MSVRAVPFLPFGRGAAAPRVALVEAGYFKRALTMAVATDRAV